MAEESENPEWSAPGAEAAAAGVDPAAVALALAGASREEADVFLKKQGALIDDQRHYVRERYKQLVEQVEETWLRVWQLRLGVLLRLATAVVGVAVALAVALIVWDAAHADGLIIEPFSVPPDLAARGLTGQVVAAQVLDKLIAMQDATLSYRAPQSYANNWGNDIKVEIPETGVSIGEARRFLREWLGHDTHITGEVWRTDNGIAINARAGGDGGATYGGPQSDFDALVQKAAEHVYARTQPYRYANYVRGHGRYDEAHAIYLRLTDSSSALERGWAWYGIGVLSGIFRGNNLAALWAHRKAAAAYPDLTIAYAGISNQENGLGHPEAALAAAQKVEQLLARPTIPDIAARSLAYVRLQWPLLVPMLQGDFPEALRRGRIGADLPDQQGFKSLFRGTVASALAFQHEAAAARAAMRDVPAANSAPGAVGRAIGFMRVAAALEDWKGTVQAETVAERTVVEFHADSSTIGPQFRPWLALARAHLGDIAGAQAIIAAMPGDCYDCMRIRGAIAALAKQPGRADYWFARAVQNAPSIPFAYADWGQALLARGDLDGAVAKFTLANRKGPHFADPLEMWGEALMAQNRSDLALAKFTQAEKYAPNWGRLHLKWGEALVYAGKTEAAKKQFAIAAGLDLTAADKSELLKVSTHV